MLPSLSAHFPVINCRSKGASLALMALKPVIYTPPSGNVMALKEAIKDKGDQWQVPVP